MLLSSSPANAREGAGAEHLAGILQKPILRADLYRSLQAITGTNLPETPIVAAPPHPGEARQMRVLVAEDNRTNQLVFQKMVRDIDIDLVFADNGVKAVALWQSFQVSTELSNSTAIAQYNFTPPVNQEATLEYSLGGAKGLALSARYPVSVTQ